MLPGSNKIVSIDIDGTLTDYPKPWLSFLRTQTGQDFDSVFSAKNAIGLKTTTITSTYGGLVLKSIQYKFEER